MNRFRAQPLVAVLALLGVATVACKRAPSGDEASIQRELDQKGTLDVLEEVSKAEYTPPADGKLSEQQMEMYVAVKQREKEILEVAGKNLREKTEKVEESGEEKMGIFDAMRAMGDLGDIVTADLRAAQELGHNPQELQWVKEKLLEAQMAEMTQGFEQMASSFQAQTLQMLEQQKANLTDPAQQAEIDRQIEELERQGEEQQAGASAADPAIAHNRALLERYKDQIDVLQAETARLQAFAAGHDQPQPEGGAP